MDLTQSQEQDKLIQYYLNQQIKKATDERTQLTQQQQQERDKIKLQVWELLTQQQQLQNPTPLSLISNNSAQSDRFDIQMSKYKPSKFEQSIQFQKELPNFQINYHSFVDQNNKDEQYKQLDKLIAQYEERNKLLPKNYFQKQPDQQQTNQLQQDKDENDDYNNQDFEIDEEIQEDIDEDQESQIQNQQKSYKLNQPEPETAYSNLIKLRIDRIDTSVVNGSKINDLSKLSESMSDLKITPSETEKILEISKQIDASKLNTFKFEQTLLQTKQNDNEKNESFYPNSKLFELSQQQSKMYEKHKIDYPQMPILDYDLSYRIQDQSQIGRSFKQEQLKQTDNYSKYDLPKTNEQSKFNNTKSQFDSTQRNKIQFEDEIIQKHSQFDQQNEIRQKEYQDKQSQFTKITDHQQSRFTEPLKRNQQSDLNYYPNLTCTNSNATKVQMIENDQKIDEFYEEQNQNYLEEEEEAFSEEDDHGNKFYQFSIKFEDQDEKEKQKKFEALKKKKIQEMEELKILRQQRNKEQQNNKRDPSPLMPSASLKRLQQQQIQEQKVQQFLQQPDQKYQNDQKFQNEQKYYPEQKYFQQDQKQQQQPPLYSQPQQQKNIFQETPIQPIPHKRNVSANRKSPMSRQKETAHFCMDIDRSVSVEKTKKSNKTMIKNAITYACLAGEPNKRERESILSKLDGVEAEHFIILFKTFGRSDFRALYGYAVDSQPYLIFGQGKCPQVLTPDLVKTFFKYDSGAKQFKAIDGNKQFTIMVDAVQLRK